MKIVFCQPITSTENLYLKTDIVQFVLEGINKSRRELNSLLNDINIVKIKRRILLEMVEITLFFSLAYE
jgi:hypothetical protein